MPTQSALDRLSSLTAAKLKKLPNTELETLCAEFRIDLTKEVERSRHSLCCEEIDLGELLEHVKTLDSRCPNGYSSVSIGVGAPFEEDLYVSFYEEVPKTRGELVADLTLVRNDLRGNKNRKKRRRHSSMVE